ncbi:hypothetical protein [Streptomyces sp. NPDC058045]|uniref:hypothetical protein n=1 Tax=Streptomyces sp. NPDC058045 TaxID=3346311 RepID=UPI0036E77F2C
MRLAVGDVVRDRTDMVLGTVARIDRNTARRVVVHVPGSVTRAACAEDLEVVRRHTAPVTGRRQIAAGLVLLAAVVTGGCCAHNVRVLGGSWLLAAITAVGAYEVFAVAFRVVRRLAGPRRFRI